MQIDFHYAVTYVAARLAGFAANDAQVISYSAQFVDDAVSTGIITFDNNAMYKRSNSAHKMLDYTNFDALANHFTWVPFHFLPGNGGCPAGHDPGGTFINKLVCYPGSHVAHDMVAACIAHRDKPYGLHRLGITMHVLADTFAHQGFAGVCHKVNRVSDMVAINAGGGQTDLMSKVKQFFADKIDDVTNAFVDGVLPLGHGGALSNPDLPYLNWQYKNGMDNLVKRNNTDIFMSAVKAMHLALVRYRKNNALYTLSVAEEIGKKDLDMIRNNFITFTEKDAGIRCNKWIQSINNDGFSFKTYGERLPRYVCDASGSWKDQALGIALEDDHHDTKLVYSPGFLTSHWKLFHDALQFHKIEVVRDILPAYGICVA